VNKHNGWVPRDFWLADWEEQAIIGFSVEELVEGYRRLTFMMLDADIVAVSPTSVWRALNSRWQLTNTDISTFRTSTPAALSITCAAFWTATAATS